MRANCKPNESLALVASFYRTAKVAGKLAKATPEEGLSAKKTLPKAEGALHYVSL